MRSQVLVIIGGIFAITLVGRAGLVAATVQAADKPHAEKQDHQSATDAHADEDHSPAEAATPNTSIEEAMCSADPLIKEVSARRKDLSRREARLEERESDLKVVEKRIAEQMSALKETQQQISQQLSVLKNAANEDVAHLSAMYENMKPAKASTIFDKMDPVFAAGFLRRMNSENAGLIMANMNADKAYSVTVIIANQNAEFRTLQ